MSRLPDNLPALLRAEGLKVTALPGWKRRGRPASTGGFDPVGRLVPHRHRRRLDRHRGAQAAHRWRHRAPGPLAQTGLSRKGRVFIIAAGRANHAGAMVGSIGVVAVLLVSTVALGRTAGDLGREATMGDRIQVAAPELVDRIRSANQWVGRAWFPVHRHVYRGAERTRAGTVAGGGAAWSSWQ